jgi:uncharacterized Tic20 family protein
MNWVLSVFIYTVSSVILCFAGVGLFLLAILSILCVVFPIIGGVKANDGIEWKYPLCIPFFK